jgi:hypothetical protein
LTPIGAQVGESALKAGAPLTHNLDYFTPHIQNFKTFHCPRLFFWFVSFNPTMKTFTIEQKSVKSVLGLAYRWMVN